MESVANADKLFYCSAEEMGGGGRELRSKSTAKGTVMTSQIFTTPVDSFKKQIQDQFL